MIVCKFGGSATTKIEAIENIKKLSQDDRRKVFVFSALGKENNFDKKITDILIEITQNKNIKKNKKILFEKFNKLKNKLNIKINAKKIINKYINEFLISKDAQCLISKGEYITSLFMAKYLNIKFIPAEKLIYFQNNKINYKKIKNKLNYFINKYNKIVTCGFYGINEFGEIELFSRGGSDITGAILSKCLGAKIYENWTDVCGVMQVNPNIIVSKQIKKMSYFDLDIMTSYDANVIHNSCVQILSNTGIALKIGNIFDISDKPTTVVDNYQKVKFVSYYIKDKYAYIIYYNNNFELVCQRCATNNYIAIITKIYQNAIE